jgi:ADP-ribose pyrophosphatase YjhB (NUDIX family)
MNYCSNCGEKVVLKVPVDDNRPRYVCTSCNAIHYQNPRVVVGTIPVWKDQVLLCRRNIEPRKGLWTLPAGFLENGETVAEGARRETLEETGSTVVDLVPYLMVGIVHVNQIYLMFRASMTAMDFHPTKESSEIQLVREENIPWDDIAFKVIEKTLHYYFQDCSLGRYEFQMDQIDAPHKLR